MATSSIPGLDVTEIYDPADTRLARVRPYAPNFTLPESPAPTMRAAPALPAPTSAEGFAAMRQVANPTLSLPSPAAAKSWAERAGNMAGRALNSPIGKGLRAAGPIVGAVDTVNHFNDYKINDPEVDSTAMGTMRALGNGDFAGAGRSFSKGALETGMDLGSKAANLADLVVPGKAPVSNAYNRMLHNAFGDQLIDQSHPAPIEPLIGTSQAGAGRGFINPPIPAPGPMPPGVSVVGAPVRAPQAPNLPTGIRRSGNSFSDGSDPQGLTRVSTVGGGPDVQGINDRVSAIQASMRGTQSQLDAFGEGSSGGGVGNFGSGQTLSSAAAQRFDRESARSQLEELASGRGVGGLPLRGKDAAAIQNNAMQSIAQGEATAAGERTARMRESGETQRAMASNAVHAKTDAERNRVTMRGQDIDSLDRERTAAVQMRGQDQTAKTAASAARLDQMNKDRTFQAEQDKLGFDQAAKNFDMRQAATKSLHEEVGNMLPPGPDGKPDMVKAAQYATGLNIAVQKRQEWLQNEVAKNPGNTQAAAELAHIADRGVGALDATAKRKLIAGMQAKDVAEQTASNWNPLSSTAVTSDAPVRSMRREQHWYGDRYVTDRGDSIRARDVDYPDANLLRNGRRNTNLDILKAK